MTDLRQSTNYANFLKRQGWTVERINGISYFIKKIPILGNILKIQRPNKIDIKKIYKLEKKYKVFQTIIEAKSEYDTSNLIANGYKLNKNPYLPTKTIQIDLTQSLTKIQKRFKRNIKKGIKIAASAKGYGEPKGEWPQSVLSYSSPNEIKVFQSSWKKIIKNKRSVPSLKTLLNLRKSFPQNNSLFLASHNIFGNIIGGVIFTKASHETVYYMYGFTSNEGRASLTHASLLYQGILWAKRSKCKIFDFEGIYDERFPNKSWLGFTQFKKSFGGYTVTYPGCYTKFNFYNIFHHFRLPSL